MSVGVDTLRAIYLSLLGGGALAAAALGTWVRWDTERGDRLLGPATLVAGLACFGGAGTLALVLFELAPGWSVLAAALFAILSAALFAALGIVARRASARRAALDDLIGGLAAVSVAIEPGRAGAVTAARTSPPLILPAISRHACILPVGAAVVVTTLRDGSGSTVAEVAPLPATSDLAEMTK